MSLESILILIVVGAVAGWLAGLVISGAGFGLLGNVLIGIIGAVAGGYLLPRIGIVIGRGTIVTEIVNAFIGAVLVLLALAGSIDVMKGLLRRR